ncbi:S41 family peptidase [Lacticaseibacillus parakribbianus]|uniref:S41 family peptidase n=1 Tax=Lacticaseibacillus parakribbianus TaxID=2970927 RepID=UPI0021CB8591|nr:S41 family peptidase [Lacticaseibacillus parakribbianus]
MAKIKVPVWLMAVGMSVTLVGGAAVGYATRGTVDSANPTQATLPAGFNKVLATYATVQNNYYQDVSATKLANGAINGMLSSLDDPYSVYLQNSDKTDLDSTISASFGGIGATVQQGDNKLTIESILADTPAKKAGLKVGDQLISVNGKSVEKLDVTQAVAKIRGKIGTKVKVVVRRDGKDLTFTMTRAKITTDTVTYALAKTNKQVGVITMATFSEPTAAQFKKAVKALRKEGATRFVLDLRENPGGMLDAALQIASMCLKDGQTIVQVKPRTGKTEVYKANKAYDKGFKVTEPLAVVIDGNSASASEILAAALNQNNRGPLVGVKSFGKGTVQNVAQMSSSAELKLTIAKWLTPNGSWIHHKGLKPTIKVDYPAYAKISMISATKLQVGDQKGDVKSLQQILKTLGFDPKSQNGYYGPTTAAAVKAFQTANKLAVTGTADTKTISAMMTKLATKYQGEDPMLDTAIKAAGKE